MGRPQLPIWKEFVTTVPASADKRSPDVACVHCRELVHNARPVNLLRHLMHCVQTPDEVRVRLREQPQPTRAQPPAPQLSREELEEALARQQTLPASQLLTRQELGQAMEARQQANGREPSGDEHEDSDTELDAADTSVLSTERRPVLGKRPRVATPSHHFSSEHSGLEHVLTSIRDVMAKTLDCKRQELQLRRDELEFQKEALATKMEERRQAREEQRRDEKEQREADRQQRLELARIENEKNLAFLKAVMESAQQQRR